MRSNYDDYDEFDDRSFGDFVGTRHMIRESERRAGKRRGHRRAVRPKVDAWNDLDWVDYADYDDYDDNEFDSYYDDFRLKY